MRVSRLRVVSYVYWLRICSFYVAGMKWDYASTHPSSLIVESRLESVTHFLFIAKSYRLSITQQSITMGQIEGSWRRNSLYCAHYDVQDGYWIGWPKVVEVALKAYEENSWSRTESLSVFHLVSTKIDIRLEVMFLWRKTDYAQKVCMAMVESQLIIYKIDGLLCLTLRPAIDTYMLVY